MAISAVRSQPRQPWAGVILHRLLNLPVCTSCDRRVVVTIVGTDPMCGRCAEPS